MRQARLRWIVGLTLVVAVVAAGCGKASIYETGSAPMAYDAAEEMVEREAMPAEPQPGAVSADATGAEFVDRMIIYTGDLSLVVKDTEAAQEDVVALAEDAGGYVSNADSYAYGEGLRRINLTLRVPADAFNDTMAALRGMALEVTQDSVGSDDVTQEYVDLESRLKALEAKAERLEELMDEAEDTEAVLAVYEELSETHIRIEETKGRMQYLERRSSMATITVRLEPDELAQPVEIAGWRPQGIAKRAIEALVGTLQALATAAIWIVIYVAPVVLIIGFFIWLLIRILRAVFGRRKKRKAKDAEPEATPAE